jgi:hypothetical protein
MAKFIRQSVLSWQQFRNDIKKKSFVYEGKDFTGWDLPMHEQIRMFRMAEAQITEVANFANMTSDANQASTATAGGRSLYKKSKPNQTASFEFVFSAATAVAFSAQTGSVAGGEAARTGNFSGHYIDISTGWTAKDFGNKRWRISFETGSTISAGTTTAAASRVIEYELTGALSLAQDAGDILNVTASYYNILRDAINNGSAPTGATGAGTAASSYFSASVDSGSNSGGGRLLITANHPGAVLDAITSFDSTTASVNKVDSGRDILCGPDGNQWGSRDYNSTDFPNVYRIKA